MTDEQYDLDRELYALFASLESEMTPDPEADERLIARILDAAAKYRAAQAQTGDTMQTLCQ